MFFGLGVVVLIFMAGYWLGYKTKPSNQTEIDKNLSDRNSEWYGFIKSYLKVVKNKDEKTIISRMLSDIKAQGLVDGVVDQSDTFSYQESESDNQTVQVAQSARDIVYASEAEPDLSIPKSIQNSKKAKLDNISLLLYFGAFLFIASVGLFVAFGDFNGTLKTLIILTMALGLYGLGCWLHVTKQSLKIVGVAFAGIGMAIVPLVGFAAYSYIFNNSQAAVAWFATSLIAIIVYAHAVWLFKNSFINYVFIFTSLSLFESLVSVVSAPIYIFGWAMAIMGIILTLISVYKNIWPDLRQSAVNSGQAFIPISLFISVMLVGKTGYWQLGISLILTAAYSYLQFVILDNDDKEAYWSATHISILAAVGVFVYAATSNLQDVSTILLASTVAQAGVFLYKGWAESRMLSYAYVVLSCGLLAIMFSIGHPLQVLTSTILVSVVAYALWLSQKRDEAYVIATVGIMLAPVIFGQYFASPRLSIDAQMLLFFVPLFLQYLLILFVFSRNKTAQTYLNASALFLINVGLVVFVGLMSSPQLYTLAVSITILASISLYLRSKDNLWLYVASGLTVLPILRSLGRGDELLYAVLAGLAVNIAIVLSTKFEFSRWVGTAAWLILPVGLVKSGVVDASFGSYAGLYFAAIIGLLFARAVARGVILFSSKKPLASYASSASVSYLIGMLLAALLATSFAVLSDDNIITMLVISGISAILVICGAYVEKYSLYFAPVPFLAQWLVWLAVQPSPNGNTSIQIYAASSGSLSVILYCLASWRQFVDYKGSRSTSEVLQLASLTAGLVAPFSVVYLGNYWALPLVFIAIIGCFYHMLKDDLQSTRELIISLGVLGVIWLLCALGITEIQVHSHLVVVLFASFAVWRHYRREKSESDNYIIAAVVVATVPLLLQALSGSAGGLYGWWLLIEQIAIMIIGFIIGSRFMIRWGLYVAVGTVLYQLRGLGWAALSILAVFVIGVAIYEIQKINKS